MRQDQPHIPTILNRELRSVGSPLDGMKLFFVFLLAWILIPGRVFSSLGIVRQVSPAMGVYVVLFWLGWVTGYLLNMGAQKGAAQDSLQRLSAARLMRFFRWYSLAGSCVFAFMLSRMIAGEGLGTFLQASGVSHAYLFRRYGHYTGITILTQFMPAGAVVFYYVRMNSREAIRPFDQAIMGLLWAITLYRSTYLERTALLEVLIPVSLVVFRFRPVRIRWFHFAYFLAGFVALYSIVEIARSYQVTGRQSGISSVYWGPFRLAQYIASVYYYLFNLSGFDIPYALGQSLYRGLSDLCADLGVVLQLSRSYRTIWSQAGMTGFTTMTVLGDYYVDGKFLGASYAFAQSFVTTHFYKGWLKGKPSSVMMYPYFYLGALFLWYCIYLNTHRAIGIIIALAAASHFSRAKSRRAPQHPSSSVEG